MQKAQLHISFKNNGLNACSQNQRWKKDIVVGNAIRSISKYKCHSFIQSTKINQTMTFTCDTIEEQDRISRYTDCYDENRNQLEQIAILSRFAKFYPTKF